MNDLHSRLSTLADELTPDPDPFAQVAGARSLHRRRRRTRAGIAGAALAAALVVVGVPAAVGTLSAPGDGDVAGPSESPGDQADAVRAALSWWDGAVPEPARPRSCSAAEVLAVDSRYEPRLQPRGSTTTACLWSTDGTGNTPGEDRVELELSAAADLDAAELMARLDPDARCPWAIVFDERSPNALSVCESDGQQVWQLTILDEDSTGGWVMTAAVGTDVAAGPSVGAASVAALWGVVATSDDERDPRVDPGDRVAERFPRLSLPAPEDTSGCPLASIALATSEAGRSPEGSLDEESGCRWTFTGGSTSTPLILSGSIRFRPGEEATDLSGAAEALPACRATPLPGSTPEAVLLACPVDGPLSWTLMAPSVGNEGLWVFSASASAGRADTPPEAAQDAVELLNALIGSIGR